ncbi:GpE family phage tail protein [Acinetobacter higginsii]
MTWLFKWGPHDCESLTLTELLKWEKRAQMLKEAGAE